MTARPRLLFVSPRFLFPADEGGKIRTGNILRHMRGGAFHVTLASPAPADAVAFAADVAGLCDVFVGWPARAPSQAGRVLSLAGTLPVGVATDRSAAGRAAIARAIVAEAFDVVVADFPHATVLLPDCVDAASVVFTHNVEAEIFERHAARARGVMRAIWRDQARKMQRFEGVALRRFDTVIAVSARDADALRTRHALPVVEAIDTAVDLDFFTPLPMPDRPRADTVVFTGVMDSPANIDGIRFLADDIWPIVARARPDLRAVIVGRDPPPSMIDGARRKNLPWVFTGAVPDIRPHVAEGDVAIIPLRVGSGTRIKTFEAMAMGRPVVATTLGVEGLGIDPDVHYVRADRARDFAAAILRLMDDAPLRDRLVASALGLLRANFAAPTVARQFEAICERALARR